MNPGNGKHRIIFIDLIRALAVINMVQGHTVDVLLAEEFRTLDSTLFSLWLFNRGITAPIFLFSAGTVFTYLLLSRKENFNENPRVKKGIKRAFLLIGIGYLLRYPTPTLIDFSGVRELQWRIFFSVDVLHLIGFSLLLILLFTYLAEKTKLNYYTVFGGAAILNIILYPFVSQINWNEIVIAPVAAYFYSDSGSLFPLFPWAAYVLLGAVLGTYLSKNSIAFRSIKFSLNVALLGILSITIAYAGKYLEASIFETYYFSQRYIDIFFERVGMVLLINSALSLIAIKVESIPQIIILIGRNTLLIYVVHIVILYGSAWSRSINFYFGKTFDPFLTIASALLMIVLMIGLVKLLHYFKIKNKTLVA